MLLTVPIAVSHLFHGKSVSLEPVRCIIRLCITLRNIEQSVSLYKFSKSIFGFALASSSFEPSYLVITQLLIGRQLIPSSITLLKKEASQGQIPGGLPYCIYLLWSLVIHAKAKPLVANSSLETLLQLPNAVDTPSLYVRCAKEKVR